MSTGKFKVKANERDNQVVRDILHNDCHCYSFACCPCAHGKLEDITGSGKDYYWNDGGAFVFGTKDELKAACEAAKAALAEEK